MKVTIVLVSVLALAFAKPQHGFGSINQLKEKLLNRMPKIVGGQDAEDGEFPYQVSLQLKGLFALGHYCGGSLIAPDVVLTAGHCVTEIPSYPLTHSEVHAGLSNLANEGSSLQTSKILKTYVHESYPGGVGPNDIAIHILETPFTLNDNVKTIALPEAGSEPVGDVILSGWGSTSNTNSPVYPNQLQKATLPIVDIPACGEKLGESPLDAESNICTGPIDGKLSACSGDSGGPLVQDINGIRTVVGIVSWGEIPCGHGYPSVYTKVSNFRSFIDQVQRHH